EFHVRHGLPASDIIAPNLVELEILCEHAVNNVEEAVLAARELIAQGPQIVLVKHLARAGYSRDRFEMLRHPVQRYSLFPDDPLPDRKNISP
ncbi:bifunctional hydroxymethylpyrimidine kinase/phosphomethylpyrimidine kinase, partial [Escherichia sp. R-CC3]